MATMGLARLLPKPQRSYQVHQDEPSPVTMAHLQVRLQQPRLYARRAYTLRAATIGGSVLTSIKAPWEVMYLPSKLDRHTCMNHAQDTVEQK